MATYSFLDVQANLVGPNCNIDLGYGAATAEEGITTTATDDTNVMTIGSDGSAMHSLKAGNSGEITVTLLKTSPVNARLMEAFNYQKTSSAFHGKNTITIRDIARGDSVVCTQVAFKRRPDINYQSEGGTVAWVFDAGHISDILGVGDPEK